MACDQYTSEREYWEDVKNIVGDSPSTLNIIFPEVYLEDGDGDERIKKINSTMEEYINKGIFRKLNDTFIYVKRTQPNGKTRHGIKWNARPRIRFFKRFTVKSSCNGGYNYRTYSAKTAYKKMHRLRHRIS